MYRGTLGVLRLTISVLWVVTSVLSLPYPPSRGDIADISLIAYWVMMISHACSAFLLAPMAWRWLSAVWRAPLTTWEAGMGVFLASQVVFFIGLAVGLEAQDYRLSAFDATLGAFLNGSSGLQPLIDSEAARRNPPTRPWTLCRVAAAYSSSRDSKNDGTRGLRRLTRQYGVMREVLRAVESGPEGAFGVDEEAVRQHLRAYLAAHPVEKVGRGGDSAGESRTSVGERGGNDEYARLLPPLAEHDAIGSSAA